MGWVRVVHRSICTEVYPSLLSRGKNILFYLTDHIVKRMFTVDERFSNSLSTPAGVDYITLVRHKWWWRIHHTRAWGSINPKRGCAYMHAQIFGRCGPGREPSEWDWPPVMYVPNRPVKMGACPLDCYLLGVVARTSSHVDQTTCFAFNPWDQAGADNKG